MTIGHATSGCCPSTTLSTVLASYNPTVLRSRVTAPRESAIRSPRSNPRYSLLNSANETGTSMRQRKTRHIYYYILWKEKDDRSELLINQTETNICNLRPRLKGDSPIHHYSRLTRTESLIVQVISYTLNIIDSNIRLFIMIYVIAENVPSNS